MDTPNRLRLNQPGDSYQIAADMYREQAAKLIHMAELAEAEAIALWAKAEQPN